MKASASRPAEISAMGNPSKDLGHSENSSLSRTLANRKMAIKWMKKNLPYLNYAYGNGINSSGYSVRAPYMGNALHVDTK